MLLLSSIQCFLLWGVQKANFFRVFYQIFIFLLPLSAMCGIKNA